MRKKHGKNLIQGSRRVPVGTMKTEYTEQNIYNNENAKVPASKCHNEANIYKYLKMPVHIAQNKNVNFMRSHLHSLLIFTTVILHAPTFLSSCKYWPDDGLLRPKLVANNIITMTQTNSCVRRSTYLILYRVIQNDCRGVKNLPYTIHLVLQMQPLVISFYGVTSRFRFMPLLFPVCRITKGAHIEHL